MTCRCASGGKAAAASSASHAFDVDWAICDPTDRDSRSEEAETATADTCACSTDAADPPAAQDGSAPGYASDLPTPVPSADGTGRARFGGAYVAGDLDVEGDSDATLALGDRMRAPGCQRGNG